MSVQRSLFNLLKSRSVAPLVGARLSSSTGDGFGHIALAWGTLQLGHGPGGLSLVLACRAVPALLVLVGGVLGDRFRRHVVLAGAEVLAAVTWGALAACFLGGGVPLGLLCLLAFVSGLERPVFMPTLRSIVVDLVRVRDRQNTNALLGQADSAGLLIGLALSGIVVAAVGPGWAAAMKAASGAVSVLLLIRLNTSVWRPERPRLLTDLRTGWREFASTRWVWVLTVQFTAVAVSVSTFMGVVGPSHMSQGHGGSGAWGVVAGCEAFGALLGGFVAARWRPARPALATALLPASAAGPMLLLGAGVPWPALAAAMLVPGVGQAVYFVLWSTTLQREFPPQMLARINSWGLLGNFALTPLTLLAAGPLTSAIGPRNTATASALLILAATAATLTSAQVRRLPAASEEPLLLEEWEEPMVVVVEAEKS
ncbi:MFS transporter [Thermomonospora amylolytica]|uniref:MFS transporter n=1 Tax=Thermomonospora amylolytica TaxID=1411117 RepID=UPI000E6B6FAA|nr:MFS transporter [Thermomonospora amylolytica]